MCINVLSKEIILGGGCFWCTQAVFDGVKGVVYTEVGYSGGKPNPSYESVVNGDGNIEVAKIVYDEKQISLEKILEIFFKMHDPTSKDKQGADEGIQYRSAIFYQDDEDLTTITNFIKSAQRNYSKAILTQVSKLQKYYKGEEYHQKYFEKNPNQAYCRFVIVPKLEKTSDYR
ncbi:peptide-methionine (S)-S-oxide reductase MsrA [Campylobacter peloridis]|uniref:peptide-methionine (S)-S-oxide reductase MsrA n=1 Tax=Campylobacter peloridis TaxID=488546 RepID=UPI001C738CF7|nr:peptide-methionine (S)-S-oxide reductase MsrA [Campylobacter peloridis]MBX2079335.1 peptide-methionine (S)-S-oxide reductase MsrA [Campylobacter peloridis]